MTVRKMVGLCVTACLCVSGAAAFVTGCSTDSSKRTAGQYIDDKELSHRVSSALRSDPEYKFSDVDVKVYRGTVELSGFVTTSAQKRRADDIARRMQGVTGVENNISVKPTLSQNP
jgi:hyperosmotically inducible periplasmic protein